MIGCCNCAAVTIELARRPDFVNFCDCSFCSKNGGAWAYFTAGDVTITGETASYMRSDIPDPVIIMHSCKICHSTTHWTLPEGYGQDRIGINIRLFAPDDCAGIEARFMDGRNWTGDTEPQMRKPHEAIGPENFN